LGARTLIAVDVSCNADCAMPTAYSDGDGMSLKVKAAVVSGGLVFFSTISC
jgi:hypothetical protein